MCGERRVGGGTLNGAFECFGDKDVEVVIAEEDIGLWKMFASFISMLLDFGVHAPTAEEGKGTSAKSEDQLLKTEVGRQNRCNDTADRAEPVEEQELQGCFSHTADGGRTAQRPGSG